MNFKEQYKATFSEIRASETITRKLPEVKNMEGKTTRLTKGSKKMMAILVAAALAATSAVVVSAAALGGAALDHIKLFVNGKEVSASDYMDGHDVKLTYDDGEINLFLPQSEEDDEFEIRVEQDENEEERICSTTVTIISDDESVSEDSDMSVFTK